MNRECQKGINSFGMSCQDTPTDEEEERAEKRVDDQIEEGRKAVEEAAEAARTLAERLDFLAKRWNRIASFPLADQLER